MAALPQLQRSDEAIRNTNPGDTSETMRKLINKTYEDMAKARGNDVKPRICVVCGEELPAKEFQAYTLKNGEQRRSRTCFTCQNTSIGRVHQCHVDVHKL
jgi:hypothetical protein